MISAPSFQTLFSFLISLYTWMDTLSYKKQAVSVSVKEAEYVDSILIGTVCAGVLYVRLCA